MASVDYFLRIESIPGESVDTHHPNEIVVESWSFGDSDAAAAGGAGKVRFHDFHFSAVVSKASPKLVEAAALGSHLAGAVLTCRKSSGFQVEFLVLKFSDVVVSSYATGAAAASETAPIDQVALAFAKVEIDDTEEKPDGKTAPPIQVMV